MRNANACECNKCGRVFYTRLGTTKCPRCKNEDIMVVAQVGN